MNHLKKPYLGLGSIFVGVFMVLIVQAATYEEGIAAYNSGDDSKSFLILKPLADAGDSKSQNMVDFMYLMGMGVDPSKQQATHYYRMAAQQGNRDAQENLARQYHLGQGVEKSDEMAIKWYKKAASQGSETAATSLAGIQPPQLSKGFSLYSQRKDKSQKSDKLTQNQINNLVKEGYVAYEAANYPKALNIWTTAAKAGNAEAQTNISIQYSYAIGTDINKDKAKQWLDKALTQNYARAYAYVAKQHLNGLFRPKSILKAFEYYQEAVYLGDISSIYELGAITEGWGNLKDALSYYKQAAEKGHIKSQATMGAIYDGTFDSYQEQNIVSIDWEKSMKWYLKAAQNDFHYAIYKVGYNYKTGRGVEKSLAKATYWLKKCARMGGQECVMSLSKEQQLAVKDEMYQMALTQAQSGDANAQYNLAQAYKYGDGVEKSASQSEYWLSKSAKQGYSKAMVELADIYADRSSNPQALKKSNALYQKLAKYRLEPRAVVNRAISAYQSGDYDLAFVLAKPYADRDNKFAQNIVGNMYNFGRGVAKSKQQAKVYLTKASTPTQDILQKSVVPEAQNNLGFLYEFSYNNAQQAALWYAKAAQSEHAYALASLARLYSSGVGVIQDTNKAIALYARAEAAGYKMAATYKQTAQSELRIEQQQLKQMQIRAKKTRIKQLAKQVAQQRNQNKTPVSTYTKTYTYPKAKKKFWSWNSFMSSVTNPQKSRGSYALDGWQPNDLPVWKPDHLKEFRRKLDKKIDRIMRKSY